MRTHQMVAVAAVTIGVLALAACGGGASSNGATQNPVVPVTVAMSTAVKSGDTPLGKVLVSPSGLTLYALTTDTQTTSSCAGACAQVWPPLLVDKGWKAAPGLDGSLFGTLVRSDGSHQLVAGQWPLYTFSGDTKPGAVNGEGSGGVWFAAGTSGQLVKSATATPTKVLATSGY
jgi:predicted lipoprotein with Yx(FWY)xxD motif